MRLSFNFNSLIAFVSSVASKLVWIRDPHTSGRVSNFEGGDKGGGAVVEW